ncbi:MAG: DUF2786 domain-containing protein, partial [bacterium]
MAQAKPRSREGRDDPERRLLRGLAFEWEAALWVLRLPHRQAMRRPLFSLGDMKKRWGVWDRERREISISRDLVHGHSWDSVREVLHHEMAHQLADEVLGSDGQPAHGPAFQQACRLLRANPRASASWQPLDERILRQGTSGPAKRLVRVKKLLALAESPDRHEAEAAMAKAHELMARYNLDLVEQRLPRDFVTAFAGKPRIRHPAEDYHLANLLQEFYFVRCMWVPAYVLDRDRSGRVLEISGTPQNVRLAGYVFDFVRGFVECQWSAYNRERKLHRARRTDFAIGILRGFRSRLIAQQQERAAAGTGKGAALIVLKDPLLEEHMAYMYPRVTTVRRGPSRQDRRVLDAGFRAGQELVIHQGIEERGGARGRLLKWGRMISRPYMWPFQAAGCQPPAGSCGGDACVALVLSSRPKCRARVSR